MLFESRPEKIERLFFDDDLSTSNCGGLFPRLLSPSRSFPDSLAWDTLALNFSKRPRFSAGPPSLELLVLRGCPMLLKSDDSWVARVLGAVPGGSLLPRELLSWDKVALPTEEWLA
jgi:hypothetical protein